MAPPPLNYRSFNAACTDTFLPRISVYWMMGLVQLSRADYTTVYCKLGRCFSIVGCIFCDLESVEKAVFIKFILDHDTDG